MNNTIDVREKTEKQKKRIFFSLKFIPELDRCQN